MKQNAAWDRAVQGGLAGEPLAGTALIHTPSTTDESHYGRTRDVFGAAQHTECLGGIRHLAGQPSFAMD